VQQRVDKIVVFWATSTTTEQSNRIGPAKTLNVVVEDFSAKKKIDATIFMKSIVCQTDQVLSSI